MKFVPQESSAVRRTSPWRASNKQPTSGEAIIYALAVGPINPSGIIGEKFLIDRSRRVSREGRGAHRRKHVSTVRACGHVVLSSDIAARAARTEGLLNQ